MNTAKGIGSLLHYLDPNPQGRPVVLLLHGLGADSESWAFQAQALVLAGMRPVMPDLPGFGRSHLPAGVNWSISLAAKTVLALVDSLGIDRFLLVGHSMGGTVAQQLALMVPQRIEKLVLLNTFSRLRPRHWSELVYLTRRLATASLRGAAAQAQSVAWRVFPAAEQAELRRMLVEKITNADPRAYRAAMRALGFFNARRKLKDLRMPVLVLSGEKDNTVPLENQNDLLRDIPGARQIIIPGAGHAMTVTHVAEVNQALIVFIQRDERTGNSE